MVMEIVAAVLVALLLAFTAIALLWGAIGGLFGERIERCPRCGRLDLTFGGSHHPWGCPLTGWERAAHLGRVLSSHGHLRHH
jgi:hypothetical protein